MNAACHSALPFSSLRSPFCLWETFFFFFYSLPSSFSVLFYLDFYKLTLFSPLFPPNCAGVNGEGPGRGGNGLKRCGIFFIGLGTRHMVLWPFLHSHSFPCFASYDFLVLRSSSRLSKKQICLLYLCPLKCLCVFEVENN